MRRLELKFRLYCVQPEKPSFLATKPAVSTQLAGVADKTLRRRKNSVFEVDLSIAAKYSVKATVIAQDLGAIGAPQEIFNQLEKAGITVDALINNSGFASYGFFHELDTQKELDSPRASWPHALCGPCKSVGVIKSSSNNKFNPGDSHFQK